MARDVSPSRSRIRRRRTIGARQHRENGTVRAARDAAPSDRSVERPSVTREVAADAPPNDHGHELAPMAGGVTLDPEQVNCPKCGGRTWDNRLTKRNPKAPDFKCRDRSCDGVVWPPRGGASSSESDAVPSAAEPTPAPVKRGRKQEKVAVAAESTEVRFDTSPLGGDAHDDDDDLPF